MSSNADHHEDCNCPECQRESIDIMNVRLEREIEQDLLSETKLALEIKNSLEKTINKIRKWLEEYRQGVNPEMKRKPVTMNIDIWLDMQEERYEYLEGFLSSLDFIHDHPDKEMQI